MSATDQLRVLFVSRHDVDSRPGGDTVQMHKTCEELQKLGVDVTIGNSQSNLKDYHLLHFFNLQNPNETIATARRAKSMGLPIVISTIYWNLDALFIEDFYANSRFKIHRALIPTVISQRLLHLYLSLNQRKQASLLRLADMLLPNSEAEAIKLHENFTFTTPVRPIPNAVDLHDFSDAQPEVFRRKYNVDRYILCVARIQRAKNQLRLIQACDQTNLPLVLVGQVSEPTYYEECIRATNTYQRVLYIPQLAHSELRHAYAGALVHVLPSFRETPGLSSLEAAVCGTPIVSGTEGSQREYFGDQATYCEPSNVASIAQAIQTAMSTPQIARNQLRERIQRKYTWTEAARKTLLAYRELI